jgi:hypothetical protein
MPGCVRFCDSKLAGGHNQKSQMTREGYRYLVNEGYQTPLRVVSVKTRYWSGGYERGIVIRTLRITL